MIRKLVHILKRDNNRQVASNVFSLSALQVANAILPLIAVPYIVRVIGPKDYGTIAFAQAFATYFVLLVNYGFDLSASREIARIRDDKSKLADVFWSVIWTKAALFVLSLLAFITLLITVNRLQQDWQVMAVTFLIVIGYVAFPTWLFQGLEKLELTAIFYFIIKVIFTAGIFAFVRKQSDFLLVPLLASLGQIVAGVLAFSYARIKLVKGIRFPTLRRMKEEVRSGSAIFLATIFVSFYTSSNVVILGFFASQAKVGYFAGATRIVMALQALMLTPIAQATYPHIGKLMSEDRKRGGEYLKKTAFVVVLITLPASLMLFVLAPLIVKVILGAAFIPSITVLEIVSPFPLMVGLTTVFGYQGVLNLNLDKKFFAVIAFAVVLNLLMNLVLAPRLQEVGTAIAWLVTEVYIACAFTVIMEKSGIGIFEWSFYKQWLKKEFKGA